MYKIIYRLNSFSFVLSTRKIRNFSILLYFVVINYVTFVYCVLFLRVCAVDTCLMLYISFYKFAWYLYFALVLSITMYCIYIFGMVSLCACAHTNNKNFEINVMRWNAVQMPKFLCIMYNIRENRPTCIWLRIVRVKQNYTIKEQILL